MNVAIVFAGGSGQRMKQTAKPKQFLELYGKPIIIYTLEVFERHPDIDMVIVPCIDGWQDYLGGLLERFQIKKVKQIIKGGKDTQESKMNALRYLKNICKDDDIIILHDAVRPLVTEKLLSDNLECVKKYGSAVSAVPFPETCILSDDKITTSKTISRNTLYIAKAPQSFYYRDVFDSHSAAEDMPYTISIDTCSVMTELGKTLQLVPCDSTNIKITTPEDYYIFKALVDLKASQDLFGI